MLRLCKCGCGQQTIWDSSRKKWNTYIHGHNVKESNLSRIKNPDCKTTKNKWWKNSILERDDYTCQRCFAKKNEKLLHTHHIKSREEYPELIYDLDNGITLCVSCHSIVTEYTVKAKTNISKSKISFGRI